MWSSGIISSRLGGNNHCCPLYDSMYASFNSSSLKIFFLDSSYYNLSILIIGQPVSYREFSSSIQTDNGAEFAPQFQ